MKKLFVSKGFIAKIALVLVIILVFEFVASRPVQASLGGTLLQPVVNLAVYIADGAMDIMQRMIMSLGDSSDEDVDYFQQINLKGSIWTVILVCVCIALVVAVIAFVGVYGGVALLAKASIIAVKSVGQGIAIAAAVSGGLGVASGVVWRCCMCGFSSR